MISFVTGSRHLTSRFYGLFSFARRRCTELVCLIGVFIPALLTAQVSQQTSHASSASDALLWRISGPDLKQPSYLFGTMHALCKEDFVWKPKMDSTLQTCNLLVMELDISDPAMWTDMMQYSRMPDSIQWADYFRDEAEFNQFKDSIEAHYNITFSLFLPFKPFMLISALTLQDFSCHETVSYENKLQEFATSHHLPVKGLEHVSQQIGFFDAFSKQDMHAMLLEALQPAGKTDSLQKAMIQCYRKEDLIGLYQLMHEDSSFNSIETRLLTSRNEDWMTKLPNLLAMQSCFIAVGAGHLPGDKGLIALLRKAGYQVDPLP